MSTEACRPIVVTGANGFVGSHVVEALVASGRRVRALVRPGAVTPWPRPVEGLDIRQTTYGAHELERLLAGARAVVHVAGRVKANRPEEFFEANVRLTQVLFETAARVLPTHANFVFLSSLAARGPSGQGPVSPYGASKAAAERYLLSRSGRFGIVVIRPTAVFGPRDRAFLPVFRAARLGLFAAPTPWSRRLSFCYVEDLAQWCAEAACGSLPSGLVAEAASVPDITVAHFRRSLERAVERPLLAVPIPGRLFRAAGWVVGTWSRLGGKAPLFDLDKARELSAEDWAADTRTLGSHFSHEPELSFSEALRRTYQWLLEKGWL